MVNENIEESIANCTELEKDIGEAISRIPETEQGQRRKLVREIEEKIKALIQDRDFMDCEINEMQPGEERDSYQEKLEYHNECIKQLQDQLVIAQRGSDQENQKNAQGLMDDALKLQNIQKNSLDNSLSMVENMKQIGADTAVEIKRQQEQMQKASSNLDNMDSELDRAKVVLKNMFGRVAGDKCIRVLAIIVALTIIAAIVVSIVKPSAIKNTVEQSFSSSGGTSDNSTGII
ncbi:hypothetical protein TVAG_446910 [Trichomonas vaginalis G3]|uniref:t-SNARE coiled-coil homology domain-containing protein n=1 Tax=Trichomonas vaginalis (strain ATCC PRA-98 / G3) TaxID=412133 RepID=A2E8Q0_TRIV3|nr:vesicle transport V-SNARE 13 family [Trichomonas vaginalis G3]EAY10989.1 hypothetical protein TVAG_446910 [Trichomonas vaginalis G3]KAI5530810.1 vesicle transport V-SNARE 13 family [Trichomonas vaginalis G3]|eukprot:XP_001323212.1 hypothetical protein [Trichomonas vaginalis G3]